MHVGVVLYVDMASRVCQRTPWWRMWRMPRQQVLELWAGEVRHGWWGEVAHRSLGGVSPRVSYG